MESLLKSAAEIVMDTTPAPPAITVESTPDAPEIELPLLAEDIERQLSCNGHNHQHAAEHLRAEHSRKLAKLQIASPQKAEQLEALKSQIGVFIRGYYEVLAAAFESAWRVEDSIIQRAATLADIERMQSELSAAEAQLDSPESLELSGEQLLVLTNKKKFLPGKIREAVRTTSELETVITSTAKEAGIDVQAVCAALISGARDSRGKIVDQHIFNLARFISPPA